MSDDAIVLLIVLGTLAMVWLANRMAVKPPPPPEPPRKVGDIRPEDYHRIIDAIKESLGDNSSHAYAMREHLLGELDRLNVSWSGEKQDVREVYVWKNRGEEEE